MPVILTLFISLIVAGGFFITAYFALQILTSRRRIGALPRLGLAKGEKSGELGVWVKWEPAEYAIEIYRVQVNLANPSGIEKERRFTVTFDSPQNQPFYCSFPLPDFVKALVENKNPEALVSFTAKTVNETPITLNYPLSKLRKIYANPPVAAVGLKKILFEKLDPPPIMTLDYSELLDRKQKIAALEAAAKAKADKKPAPAPAGAKPETAPAPATVAPKAVEAKVAAATNQPAPEDK